MRLPLPALHCLVGLAVLATVCPTLACLDTHVDFACKRAEDCVAGDVQGTCETSGYCAFPDATCPSGRRFGELSLRNEASRCTHCGDGVLDEGEECDDKNHDESDACLSSCKWNTCGDGFVRTDVEECDDGNRRNGDQCSSACSQCRHGAASFTWETNQSCYFRETGPLAWEAAERACGDAGAHLATYVTDIEHTVVAGRLLPANLGASWIGIRDEAKNGVFSWVTSEPLNRNLLPWSRAPSGSRPIGSCLTQTGTAPWTGVTCTAELPFVCEKDPWETRAVDNHAYKAFYVRLPFEEAAQTCRALGAHLATLTSPDEHGFLTAKYYGYFWLGAQRLMGEKGWKWVTGEPFMYSDFLPGNPNEPTGAACLTLTEERKWRGRTCDRPTAFICERE